jgi:hypothetical protein
MYTTFDTVECRATLNATSRVERYTIENNVVSGKVEASLTKVLMNKKDGYGMYTGTIREKGITADQALSLRKQLLRTKAIRRAGIISKQLKKLRHAYYKKKTGILAIAKRIDMPPLMVRKILNRPETKRDKEQIKLAAKHDILECCDPNEVLKYADLYEDTVNEWLVKQKISFITQETLVRQQTKKFGRPVSTPDFLLKKPIMLNGHKVHWIDAKNYFGASQGFLLYKARQQAEKYRRRYGPGALCYSLGFSSAIHVDNTLVISLPRKHTNTCVS